MKLFASGLVVVLSIAGCGGDAAVPVDAGIDLASAVPDGSVDGSIDGSASGCAAMGPSRAVVIVSSGAAAELRVMGQTGGVLVDHGLRFTSIPNPDGVAMRADGAEAVFSWGGFGTPYGISVVTLSPDGTAASVGTPIQLGTGLTPEGIDYLTSDRVLLVASAQQHFMITLERQGATFVEVARLLTPGSFPLEVKHRPGSDEALFPRATLGTDPATTVELIAPVDGGTYAPLGSVGMVTPASLSVSLHPSGQVAYSSTANANDPVSSSHLDVTGSLFVLGVGPLGITMLQTLTIPRSSDFVAVDPAGRFLVVQGTLYELDSTTSTPIIHYYSLLTLSLDGTGLPMPTASESPKFPALLFNDMKLSPSGHLLLSRTMYPSPMSPANDYPLELRAQSAPGQWEVCQTLYLPGAGHVAIAGP